MTATTIITGSTFVFNKSYNHEEAVLDALHVAHKNHRLNRSMSSSMGGGSARSSCLKDGSSKRHTTSTRRVSFCDKGHACEEFEMYSEEDVEHVWFSATDYDDMKSAFEFTIFMMDAGCPEKVEDDEHTTRGLEKRSEEGQWKRYERKRDYYNAVLDEQERQWEIEEDDQEKISQIAVDVTRESFLEAKDQGVLDEIAVYGSSLRSSDVTVDITVSSTIAGSCTRDENDSWPSDDFSEHGPVVAVASK